MEYLNEEVDSTTSSLLETKSGDMNESDLMRSSSEVSNGDNSRLTQTDRLNMTDQQTSPGNTAHTTIQYN